MFEKTPSRKSRIRFAIAMTTGIATGIILSMMFHEQTTVQAEVRKTAPRATFSSGAIRSEKVLQDILSTLNRIDSRLERIERAASAKPTR